MKHVATVVVLLHLGAAGVYAQQTSVKMNLSGTSAPSTVNLLQPDSHNDEDSFAGTGTLGSFTVRHIRAISNTPTTSSTCSGPNQLYFQELAGGGVFRFQDNSLLYVTLIQGSDCIDFAVPPLGEAHCTMSLQITGGTGRFKNASGNLLFTETVLPTFLDASNNPAFFAASGQYTGTVSGVSKEHGQNEGQ